MLNGIVYVLNAGCQWKMLPKEYSSGSICHRRFLEWVRKGVFKKIWMRLLKEYDCREGI
jgi:transposase